jgi:hypothetical protein
VTLAAARARWAVLPPRERSRVVGAVRAGRTVDPADAAVAVRVADRELDRLARMDRPLAMRLWRGWALLVIVAVTVGAAVRFLDRHWLGGLWLLVLGTMVGYSLVTGRKRLERQRAVLRTARAANAALLAGQETGPEV